MIKNSLFKYIPLKLIIILYIIIERYLPQSSPEVGFRCTVSTACLAMCFEILFVRKLIIFFKLIILLFWFTNIKYKF